MKRKLDGLVGLMQRGVICLSGFLNLSLSLVEIYVLASYNYMAFGKRCTRTRQGKAVRSNITTSARQLSQQKQRKEISVREITSKKICRKVNKRRSSFVEMKAVTKDSKHLVVSIIC